MDSNIASPIEGPQTSHHLRPKLDLLYRMYNNGRQASNDYLTDNTKYTLQGASSAEGASAAHSSSSPISGGGGQALGPALEKNRRILESLLKRWKKGRFHHLPHPHGGSTIDGNASTSLGSRRKKRGGSVANSTASQRPAAKSGDVSRPGDAFGPNESGDSSSTSSESPSDSSSGSSSSSLQSTSSSESSTADEARTSPTAVGGKKAHQKRRRTKTVSSSMFHHNGGISMYDLAMMATKKAEDINDIYAMGAKGARLLLGLDDPSIRGPQEKLEGLAGDDRADGALVRNNSNLSETGGDRRRSNSRSSHQKQQRRRSSSLARSGKDKDLSLSDNKAKDSEANDRIAEKAARALAIRSMVDSKWAHTIQKSPLQRLTPLDIEELRIAWLMACADKQTNGGWRGEIRRRLEGVGLIDRNPAFIKAAGVPQRQSLFVGTQQVNNQRSSPKHTVLAPPSGRGKLHPPPLPRSTTPPPEAKQPQNASPNTTVSAVAPPLSPVDLEMRTSTEMIPIGIDIDDETEEIIKEKDTVPAALPHSPPATPVKAKVTAVLNDLTAKRSEVPNNLLLEIFARHNYYQSLSDEPTTVTSSANSVNKATKTIASSSASLRRAPPDIVRSQSKSSARLPSYSFTTAAEAAAAAFAHHQKDRPSSQQRQAGRAQSITDVTSFDDVEAALAPTLSKHLLEGLPSFHSDITQQEFASILKIFFIRSGTFDSKGMKQSLYQLVVQIVQESAGITKSRRDSNSSNDNSRPSSRQHESAVPVFGAAVIGDSSSASANTAVPIAATATSPPSRAFSSGALLAGQGGRRKSNAVTFLQPIGTPATAQVSGLEPPLASNSSNQQQISLSSHWKSKYNTATTAAAEESAADASGNGVEQLRSGVTRGTELASFLGALFTSVDTARRHQVSWDDFLTHLLSEVYGIEADSRLSHSTMAGLSTSAIKEEILLRNTLSLKKKSIANGIRSAIGQSEKREGQQRREGDESEEDEPQLDDQAEMVEAKYRAVALANAPLMGTSVDRLRHVSSRIDSLPPTAIAAEFMRRKKELKAAIKEESRRPGGGRRKKAGAGAANGDGSASSTTGAPNAPNSFAIVERKGYTLSYPSYSVHHVTTLKAFPQWGSVVALDNKCAAIFSYEDIDSWGLSSNKSGVTQGGDENSGNPNNTTGGEQFSTSSATAHKSAFVQKDDDVVGGAKYLQFEGKIMAVECIFRDRLLIFSIGEREQLHLFQITGRNNLRFIGKFELPLFSVEHHEKIEKDQQMKEIHAKAISIAKAGMEVLGGGHHQQQLISTPSMITIPVSSDTATMHNSISGNDELTIGEVEGLRSSTLSNSTPSAQTLMVSRPNTTTATIKNGIAVHGNTLPTALEEARFKAIRKQRSKEKKDLERKQRLAIKKRSGGVASGFSSASDNMSTSSSGDEDNGPSTLKSKKIARQKRFSDGGNSPSKVTLSPPTTAPGGKRGGSPPGSPGGGTGKKKISNTTVSGLTTITCLREWRDSTNSIVGFGNGAGGSSMLLLGGTRDGIFFGLSVHDVDGLKRNGAQILFQYRLHMAPINDILVLPNSGRVVTCSLDGRLLSHLPNGAGKVGGSGANGRAGSQAKQSRSSTPAMGTAKRESLTSAGAMIPQTSSLLPPWKRTLYEYVEGHERSITSLAYCGDHESTASAKSQAAAAASSDGADGQLTAKPVKSLSSSTGEVFVSAGLEFKIFCWTDTMTRPLMVLNDTASPFRAPIIKLMAVPLTPLLYAVDAIGMVKLFDVRAGRSLGTWRTGGGTTNSTAINNAIDSMDSDSEADDGGIAGAAATGGASQAAPQHRSKKKNGMMIMQGSKKGSKLLFPGQTGSDGTQILSACYTGSNHRTILFGSNAVLSKFHTEARTDFSNRASQEPVLAIGISRTIIITVSTTAMRTWSAYTGKVLTTHSTDTYSVAPTVYATVDSSGGVIVIGKENGFVETFDINDGQMLRRYCYHSSPIVGLQLDPDCGLIVSAAQGGEICVWRNHDARTHGAYVGAANPNVLAAKRLKYGVTSAGGGHNGRNHHHHHGKKSQQPKSISKVRREIDLMEKSPWLGLSADCGNSSSTLPQTTKTGAERTASVLSTNHLNTLVGAIVDPVTLTSKVGLRESQHRTQLCNEARLAWWSYHRWRRYLQKKLRSKNQDATARIISQPIQVVNTATISSVTNGFPVAAIAIDTIQMRIGVLLAFNAAFVFDYAWSGAQEHFQLVTAPPPSPMMTSPGRMNKIGSSSPREMSAAHSFFGVFDRNGNSGDNKRRASTTVVPLTHRAVVGNDPSASLGLASICFGGNLVFTSDVVGMVYVWLLTSVFADDALSTIEDEVEPLTGRRLSSAGIAGSVASKTFSVGRTINPAVLPASNNKQQLPLSYFLPPTNPPQGQSLAIFHTNPAIYRERSKKAAFVVKTVQSAFNTSAMMLCSWKAHVSQVEVARQAERRKTKRRREAMVATKKALVGDRSHHVGFAGRDGSRAPSRGDGRPQSVLSDTKDKHEPLFVASSSVADTSSTALAGLLSGSDSDSALDDEDLVDHSLEIPNTSTANDHKGSINHQHNNNNNNSSSRIGTVFSSTVASAVRHSRGHSALNLKKSGAGIGGKRAIGPPPYTTTHDPGFEVGSLDRGKNGGQLVLSEIPVNKEKKQEVKEAKSRTRKRNGRPSSPEANSNNINEMLSGVLPHVTSLYFDRSRQTLITGDDTGEVHLWEIDPIFSGVCANPRRGTLLRIARLDPNITASSTPQKELEQRKMLFTQRIKVKPTGVPPRHVLGWRAGGESSAHIILATAIPSSTSWNFCGLMTITGDSHVRFWNMGGDEVASLRQGPVVDRVWDIPDNWLVEKVGLIRYRWLKFMNGVHGSYLTAMMKAKNEEKKNEEESKGKVLEIDQILIGNGNKQHRVTTPITLETSVLLEGTMSVNPSTMAATTANEKKKNPVARKPLTSSPLRAAAAASGFATKAIVTTTPLMTDTDLKKAEDRNRAVRAEMHSRDWVRVDGDLLECVLRGHWMSRADAANARRSRVDTVKAQQRTEREALSKALNSRTINSNTNNTGVGPAVFVPSLRRTASSLQQLQPIVSDIASESKVIATTAEITSGRNSNLLKVPQTLQSASTIQPVVGDSEAPPLGPLGSVVRADSSTSNASAVAPVAATTTNTTNDTSSSKDDRYLSARSFLEVSSPLNGSAKQRNLSFLANSSVNHSNLNDNDNADDDLLQGGAVGGASLANPILRTDFQTPNLRQLALNNGFQPVGASALSPKKSARHHRQGKEQNSLEGSVIKAPGSVEFVARRTLATQEKLKTQLRRHGIIKADNDHDSRAPRIATGADVGVPLNLVIATTTDTSFDNFSPSSRTVVLPPLHNIPLLPTQQQQQPRPASPKSVINPINSTQTSATAAADALLDIKRGTILERINAEVGTFLCLTEKARPTLKLDDRVVLQTAPLQHSVVKSPILVSLANNGHSPKHRVTGTLSNGDDSNFINNDIIFAATSSDDSDTDDKQASDVRRAADNASKVGQPGHMASSAATSSATLGANNGGGASLFVKSMESAIKGKPLDSIGVGLKPHEHYGLAIQKRTFGPMTAANAQSSSFLSPSPQQFLRKPLLSVDQSFVTSGSALASKSASPNSVSILLNPFAMPNVSRVTGPKSSTPSVTVPPLLSNSNLNSVSNSGILLANGYSSPQKQLTTLDYPEVDSRLLVIPTKAPPPKPIDYIRTLRGDTFTTPIHPKVKGVLGAVSLGGVCGSQTAILTAIPRTKTDGDDKLKSKRSK